MKRYIIGTKWKRYLQARQRYSEKQRRGAKQIRHKILKNEYRALTKSGRKRYRDARGSYRVIAPSNFSLVNNPDEFIQFLADFENACYQYPKVLIDVFNIETLTTDAIITLLAKFADLRQADVQTAFFGTFPSKRHLSKIWDHSGFNKFVESDRKQLSYATGKGDIRKTSSNECSGELAYKNIIQFAISKLYGEDKLCKGLYTVYGELMNNTVEHASGSNEAKHWWSSVYCDTDNRRAHFTFVDMGVGIFQTAKLRSIINLIKKGQLLANKDRTEILRLMFEDKIDIPRTGEKKRGHGLPTIYRRLQMKQFENLIVVSNNVYANVSKAEYRTLKQEFYGTFFYWEYSDDCT